MFTTLPIVAALATSALASPYKRFSGLSVDITGPTGSVDSVDALKLTASVTNSGSEDVKVLKYGTILDSLPSRSFSVSQNGEAVKFTGAKLSVKLSDSAYTTIPAGQTVNVTHDVSSLYDFAAVGAGKFSFEPLTSFRVAGATDKVATLKALEDVEVSSTPFEVEVTGQIAKRTVVAKRATDVCDDSSKADFIDASYTEAQELATISSDYVSSNGASDEVYSDYFSSNPTSSVTEVLDAVAGENDSSRTLNCDDAANACDGNVIAYTIISTTDIYYCDIFFDEQPSTALCSGTTVADRDIRGGTTLHELTHALSDTDDITYGCSADQQLSASQQVNNADNFNCFTTQVYADTEC